MLEGGPSKVKLGKWVEGPAPPKENPSGKAGMWVYESHKRMGRMVPGYRFIPEGFIPPEPKVKPTSIFKSEGDNLALSLEPRPGTEGSADSPVDWQQSQRSVSKK